MVWRIQTASSILRFALRGRGSSTYVLYIIVGICDPSRSALVGSWTLSGWTGEAIDLRSFSSSTQRRCRVFPRTWITRWLLGITPVRPYFLAFALVAFISGRHRAKPSFGLEWKNFHERGAASPLLHSAKVFPLHHLHGSCNPQMPNNVSCRTSPAFAALPAEVYGTCGRLPYLPRLHSFIHSSLTSLIRSRGFALRENSLINFSGTNGVFVPVLASHRTLDPSISRPQPN